MDEWHRALRLHLQASRSVADVGGPPLRGAVLALLCLARRLLVGSMARGEEVLAALLVGGLSALYLAAGTADAEVLLPWLAAPIASAGWMTARWRCFRKSERDVH